MSNSSEHSSNVNIIIVQGVWQSENLGGFSKSGLFFCFSFCFCRCSSRRGTKAVAIRCGYGVVPSSHAQRESGRERREHLSPPRPPNKHQNPHPNSPSDVCAQAQQKQKSTLKSTSKFTSKFATPIFHEIHLTIDYGVHLTIHQPEPTKLNMPVAVSHQNRAQESPQAAPHKSSHNTPHMSPPRSR